MEYPSEAEYAEAFGVELPAEKGTGKSVGENGSGEAGEGSAAASGNAAAGGNAAEKGGEGAPGPDTAEGGEGGQPAAEPPGKPVQSPEERHRQAAARRAREAQARERARAAAEQARVDKIYADMFRDQTNPYTGNPITTESEYKAYIAESQRRAREAQLKKAGLTPEAIKQVVDESLAPVKQQMESAQLATARDRARIVSEKASAAINAALKNISAIDPSIKTLEDIADLSTAPRFNQLVQMGVGLEDAFKLANHDAIMERRVAAAKASAQNQAAGKQHLNPVGPADGREPVRVPEGIREAYKEMMPGATDEQIRKEYAAYLAKKKK